MSASCKRLIGSIIFLIFGLVYITYAYKISEDTGDKKFFWSTAALYGILLLTIIRYKQYITEAQRYCFGVVVLICYCLYWYYVYNFAKNLHDKNINTSDNDIYFIVGCSSATFISDLTYLYLPL